MNTSLDGNYGSYKELTLNELTGKENFLVELGATESSVKLLVTPGNEIGTVIDIDELTRDVRVRFLNGPGEQIFVQDGAIAALGRFKGKAGGKVTAAAVQDPAIGIKKAPLTNGADGDFITGLVRGRQVPIGVPSVAVANQVAPNGTATVTIQAKDGQGNNLAARCKIEAWFSATSFGAPTDLGTLTATTGAIIKVDTTDAAIHAVTDATGLLVLSYDLVADGNLFAHANVTGVIGVGNAAITGN